MAGKEDGPGASGSAAANEVHVNVAQDPPVPVLGSPDVVDAGFEERHAARGYKACRGSIVKATFVLCIVGIVLTAVLWGDSDADGADVGVPIVCVLLAVLPIALCVGFFCKPKQVESVRLILQAKKHMEYNIKNDITTADFFGNRARDTPDREAMVFEGASYTFSDLDKASNRIAHWASSIGIGKGDCVALLMENRPEFVMTWLGICKLAGATSLLNYNLRHTALVHTINESKAKAIIVGVEFEQSIVEIADRLPEGISVWTYTGKHGVRPVKKDDATEAGAAEGKEEGDGATEEAAAADADSAVDFKDMDAALAEASEAEIPRSRRAGASANDLLFLIFTSGTTGLPKAAKIKHLRFFGAGMLFGLVHHCDENDRIYCPLPLYHSAAGVVVIGISFFMGCTAIVRRKFSARAFWQDCYENRATAVQYIGELCRYLLNTPPGEFDRKHQVRKAMGNGMRPEVWKPFQERFNVPYIGEFYGATEGNATLVNNQNRLHAVGHITDLLRAVYPVKLVRFDMITEQCIRTREGRCIECKPGEIGELIGLIKPGDPSRDFDGYSNKAATEKKILRNAFKQGDKWFRTGDLLVQDADGFFYFKDRIGDTFRWKGENVATSEVAEICSQFDAVAEVNVYGVSIPGKDGRCGMAAVVPKDQDAPFDFAAFYALVADELPTYARPVFLRMQPSMEITGTFKNRKVEYAKEGYKPGDASVTVFMADPASKTYVQLSPEKVAELDAGTARV